MICYIFKVRGRRLWRGRIRLKSESKITEVPLHTSDKQVAEQRLRQLVREKEQERAGIIPPKLLREGANCPLEKHLTDYTKNLETCGCDSDYVYNVGVLVSRLLSECNWSLPMDVTADSFVAWRNKQDKAPKTLNEYLSTICGLLNWMVKNGLMLANPLGSVGRVDTNGKERRKRRALTNDEVRRLLHVAGPFGIVYLTALLTGLRRGELAQLVWDDFHLDAPKPFLKVRAEISKNHKDADLWLHAELCAALHAFRPSNPVPSDFVFPKMPRMDHLKAHLRAAGISYKDGLGRQADFHALRHTFGTNLSIAGVPPRIAMEMMRHSDLRLTMKVYTDATRLPTAGAIDMLPGFNSADPQLGPQELGASGLGESRAVTGGDEAKVPKGLENKG